MNGEKRYEPPKEKPSEKLFKARVALDALGYIDLMKQKSPASLSLNASGKLVINLVEAAELFKDSFAFLKLETPEEKTAYLLAIEDEIMGKLKN